MDIFIARGFKSGAKCTILPDSNSINAVIFHVKENHVTLRFFLPI
jgi:hypothetical protein